MSKDVLTLSTVTLYPAWAQSPSLPTSHWPVLTLPLMIRPKFTSVCLGVSTLLSFSKKRSGSTLMSACEWAFYEYCGYNGVVVTHCALTCLLMNWQNDLMETAATQECAYIAIMLHAYCAQVQMNYAWVLLFKWARAPAHYTPLTPVKQTLPWGSNPLSHRKDQLMWVPPQS